MKRISIRYRVPDTGKKLIKNSVVYLCICLRRFWLWLALSKFSWWKSYESAIPPYSFRLQKTRCRSSLPPSGAGDSSHSTHLCTLFLALRTDSNGLSFLKISRSVNGCNIKTHLDSNWIGGPCRYSGSTFTSRSEITEGSEFKGSRQRERRGVGNVSNGPNSSRTAAIDVLFSINFAVVFDFMYFRFRPSKAKWIGNVLPNWRNAAIRSMFFFLSLIMRIAYWRTKSSCVIRRCADFPFPSK